MTCLWVDDLDASNDNENDTDNEDNGIYRNVRVSIPESWWGKRADKLRKQGIPATFVAPSGMLAGANSIEGCLEIARIAIASAKIQKRLKTHRK